MKNYFFCAVGGSGMSSLALILKSRGYDISGSDRAFDNGECLDKKLHLQQQGIQIFHQDGSGVTAQTDCVVVSTAVEETIPDVIKARELNIPVKKRAEVLAEFFHLHNGLAVGGTSGKTTTTGMLGHILKFNDVDPVVINGGKMMNYPDSMGTGSVIAGKGTFCVIEADERLRQDPGVSLADNELVVGVSEEPDLSLCTVLAEVDTVRLDSLDNRLEAVLVDKARPGGLDTHSLAGLKSVDETEVCFNH